MTADEPCYDLNGPGYPIKDVAKGGKLAAILVVQEGGTDIRLIRGRPNCWRWPSSPPTWSMTNRSGRSSRRGHRRPDTGGG